MARLLSARAAGASSPGALMAGFSSGRPAARIVAARMARLANISETHRYTGGP
jgi:hypothetical protein